MAEAVTLDEASTESTESDYYTSASEESEPESVAEEISSLNLPSDNQDGDMPVYKSVFLMIYDQLQRDPALDSDVGPAVLEVLKCIKDNCDNPSTNQLISALCIRVQSCVDKAGGCKLASSIAARVWPAFHQLRLNADLHQQWKRHLSALSSDTDSMKYSTHALQILLDRLVKLFIIKKKEGLNQNAVHGASHSATVNKITAREVNAVYYMAGYVTAKLTKRYQKKPANKVAQKKNRMFVSVLKDMVVSRVDVDVGTDYDDTVEWTELIDRGGLTHVKTEVLLA